MQNIENTEAARVADQQAAETIRLQGKHAEKNSEELKAKAAKTVFFRHSKNGAVSAMSPGLAELMARKGKGRIVNKPPEIDLSELLSEGAEK